MLGVAGAQGNNAASNAQFMGHNSSQFLASPSSGLGGSRIEDEKRYHALIRRIFHDPRRLTEGALNACRELHINPVDLMDKTQEDFSRDTTGVNYHPGQEVAVPKEIVEVRYSHYQNKRKKLFEQVAKAMGLMESKPQRGLNAIATAQTSRWKPIAIKQGGGSGTGHYNNHSRQVNQIVSNTNTITLPSLSSAKHLQINTNILASLVNSPMNHSIVNNDDLEGISASFITGLNAAGSKKVGRALFSPAASTAHSTKFSYRNSPLGSPMNHHPSDISSSIYKVAWQLQKTQDRMDKGRERVEKLKKVRQNAMAMAEQRVQKFQSKIVKDFKNTEKVQKLNQELKEEHTHWLEKHQHKVQVAQMNFTNAQKQVDKRSASGYSLKLKEVDELREKRLQRDRQHSQRHFESLRHKIEDEENNSKRRSDMKRMEDEEIQGCLNTFERKMSRGQNLALQSKRDTSSRASRSSSKQFDTLRNHSSLLENVHTRSLQKVLKKESLITKKEKKRLEAQEDHIKHKREKEELRIERNKSARSQLMDQEKRRGKMTLERISQKERLREIILERQQMELMKNKEVNTLRRLDHQDGIQRERALMNEFKVRVAKKLHQIDRTKHDIDQHLRQLVASSPAKNPLYLNIEERQVLDTVRAQDILEKGRLNLTMQLSGMMSPNGILSPLATNRRNGKKQKFFTQNI